MPGLTLQRELLLLKSKIRNLQKFISDYEKQESDFIDHILLRTLKRDLFKLILFRFDLEQRIEDFMTLQNNSDPDHPQPGIRVIIILTLTIIQSFLSLILLSINNIYEYLVKD